MKKIIISVLVAVCAISANAQTWVGGSLGFDVKDFDATDESQTIIEVSPEVGYSINSKWDVAVALEFGHITNFNGTKDADITTYGIQPYARYTFAKSGIASFFVDGYVDFGSYKPKGVDATTSFGIGVRPGVKVALSKDVCLVSTLGNLGYNTVKDSYNEFGFNVDNTTIKFGIYFSLK